MKKIRIAYLGAGEISDRFVTQAQALNNTELCAVFSRNIKNAAAKAEKYSIPAYYDNYKRMLKEVKPDAVIVTSPHSLHARHTIDCLNAGCHVLCEKPMATSYKEAKAMALAAKKNKKLLMVLPFDQYPHYLASFDLIKEKYIGKIVSAHSELSFPGPPRDNWYYDKKVAKGGAMLDVGCYALSRMITIMGGVKKISAFSNILLPKRILTGGKKITPSVDDNNVMIMEFEGGVFGTAKAMWQHPYVENRTVIYGRHGAVYIHFDGVDDAPGIVVQTKSPSKNLKKIKYRNLPDCYTPVDMPKWGPEYDIMGKFMEFISAGKVISYDAIQSLHIMEVMDKAYVSAKTGKVQIIETPFKVWWDKEKTIQKFNSYV